MERAAIKPIEAKFYLKLKNSAVQCRLCNHFCAIKNDETGTCGARKNEGGRLETLVYGRPAALQVDPIEKKPLFHFLPGSLIFSLGTYGCNFRCLNCLNYDLSQEKKIEEKNKVLPFLPPQKIVELALDSKCRSIAYTYNEPTIFTEYALDIMKLARAAGLKNVWVTNGFMSDESLSEILPYLDAANVDLKSNEENFYKKICGGRLAPVLKNLKTLKKTGAHLEVTSLVIPTLSVSEKNLKAIATFIKKNLGADTPWHLSRFSPGISWKLGGLKPTDMKTLGQAYKIGRAAGLKYVYLGNVVDKKENTYCPECGSLNIERIGYNISRADHRGRCFKCQANLNIFDENIHGQK